MTPTNTPPADTPTHGAPTEHRPIQEWYDRRHTERGAGAWRPRRAYEVFVDALAPEPGSSLLDVGCGAGALLDIAADRGARVTGVDLSTVGIGVTRDAVPGAGLAVAAGEALPFPSESFDRLSCIGALEHFADPSAGAAEFARVVRPGGRLCIVVPNADYFEWKLRGEAGTEQQDIREVLHGFDGWRSLLTGPGLEVRRVLHDDWPARRTPVFASRNPLGIAKRAATRGLWKVMPVRYTYQFVFVLEKR